MCKNQDDGRLDIQYDYPRIRTSLTREELGKRAKGVWKYRELLPVENESNTVTLGEGGTPLIRSDRLAKKLNMTTLYLKDDTRSPTASFKDRPMTVGVSKGVELGYKTCVSASSGNAAAALAAYCAYAGLTCYTFVPENAGLGKLAQLVLYGAHVVRVRGLESGTDPTVKMLRESVAKFGWYPCPSFGPFNPYQAEGPKTMSYEIAEDLAWSVPDWVIVPVGAGGLLGGNWKGYKDFVELGFVDSTPRLVAVQSDGCAPVIRANEQRKGPWEIEPWSHPDSIATGLMDPKPWDGDAALAAILESRGLAVSISNQEILEAQTLLAKLEGVYAEASGVASLAGLIKLIDQGKIDKKDRVVVEITGSGLKEVGVGERGGVGVPLINPDIRELGRILA
jgi:threonine synthase